MYTHAVLGGTFDHLHAGHHAFLSHAFSIAPHVTIGVTTDAYVKAHKITMPVDEEQLSGATCPCISLPSRQSYIARTHALTTWLDAQGFAGKYTIVPLDDTIGPAGSIDADVIVVSEETKQGATSVNAIRKQNGKSPLAVSIVPIVRSTDNAPISSTRVRNREIDQSGALLLPDTLRHVLSEPIGDVVADRDIQTSIKHDQHQLMITVGDKTTDQILAAGVVPELVIIDGLVERKPYIQSKHNVDQFPKNRLEITSGPGFISRAAMDVLEAWGAHPTPMLLSITGEEDLLVLPVIVYAPLGSVVNYGQPHVGLVRVVVTDEKRIQARQLLAGFTQIG